MKKNKGISLIVLVITIIVMIILAGSIVLTLNNSGVINRAQEAVNKTNEAQVKELAQLGWVEAYANGARTKEALEAGVDTILEKNKIDTSEYGIVVTTSGVQVVRGWIQDGLTVKRGEQILTIGDDIEYDETDAVDIDVEWKILGANEEGELLIMSTSDILVSSYILGDVKNGSSNLQECQNDWLTGVEQLDDLCEPYGKGERATGVRSITVEDVNKITGYDPGTEKYEEGELEEYENKVTISYNGTTNPAYTATNGASRPLLSVHTNGFHYYNGTDFVVADLSTATGIITTLKCDYYLYYAPDLETIDSESKAYKLIFGEEDTRYWLASPYVTMYSSVEFGMRCVHYGEVSGYDMWWSDGDSGLWYSSGPVEDDEMGVRAVVSLASDIQLTGSSEAGWSY